MTKSLLSRIGSMAAMEGSPPILRIRPALSASRKSAPPRMADCAAMPVPMAAPTVKSEPPRVPGPANRDGASAE